MRVHRPLKLNERIKEGVTIHYHPFLMTCDCIQQGPWVVLQCKMLRAWRRWVRTCSWHRQLSRRGEALSLWDNASPRRLPASRLHHSLSLVDGGAGRCLYVALPRSRLTAQYIRRLVLLRIGSQPDHSRDCERTFLLGCHLKFASWFGRAFPCVRSFLQPLMRRSVFAPVAYFWDTVLHRPLCPVGLHLGSPSVWILVSQTFPLVAAPPAPLAGHPAWPPGGRGPQADSCPGCIPDRVIRSRCL